jgi:DNA-binding XRE family transcriptional regulator
MFQFQNLEIYREQRLISRAEMARKTGLSPLTINKLEGGRSCRPDTAKKILESLDIVLNGNSFSYDENANDTTIYTSPSIRPNSAQLVLKRVVDENERRAEPQHPNKIGRPPTPKKDPRESHEAKGLKGERHKAEAGKKAPAKKTAPAHHAKSEPKTKPKPKR